MKLVLGVLLSLFSTSAALSQQIGVVDLTKPEPNPTQQQSGMTPPSDCAAPTGIMANGVIKPDDNLPRKILLEINKLSSEKLEVGSDFLAEIRLKNIGDKAINIPWSTDPSVIQRGPSPDHLQWEQANFRIVLKNKQNHTIALKGAEPSLYGTEFASGTQLTIKPGEWIAAFVNFKVEDMYHIVPENQFRLGESRLFLEWHQALRRWDRAKCGWNRVWFAYAGYYKQEHPTVPVQIDWPGSGENKDIH